MAAIDKIYGTKEQHAELTAWLQENRPALLEYLYPEPEGSGPISNFPMEVDDWLWDNCPLEWVRTRLCEQYIGKNLWKEV